MYPYLPNSCRLYFESILELCGNNGVRVNLVNAAKVEFSKNVFTSGYFDEETLTVATDNPLEEWFTVFIHESRHLFQFLYSPIWKIRTYGKDPCLALDDWLEEKTEYTNLQIQRIADAVVALERDCELQTVATIRQYNMPFDTTDYIKRANSYLYFYDLVRRHRKWYKTQPYKISEIVQIMPGRVILNHHRLTPKLHKLFRDKCYG
jgi:hypothetical protein